MPKPLINLVVSLMLVALAPVAGAALITVEPDDYAPGTDLTDISPYVTLNSVFPTYPGTAVERIYADDDGALGSPDYVAPTGNLTFGNHGYFVYGEPPNIGGFSMTFHQAVSNVSLLANNEYPPGLSALWAAFDYEGNIIGAGSAGVGVPRGETFEINIGLADVWKVIVGGDDSMAAINFDHLTFEVDDLVSVPVPAPLLLLITGLLGLVLRKSRQQATAFSAAA